MGRFICLAAFGFMFISDVHAGNACRYAGEIARDFLLTAKIGKDPVNDALMRRPGTPEEKYLMLSIAIDINAGKSTYSFDDAYRSGVAICKSVTGKD